MTHLTDWQIAAHNPPLVTPYTDDLLQPVSYEITLDHGALLMDSNPHELDPSADTTHRFQPAPTHVENGSWLLYPGDFALASTTQTIHLPDDVVARVEGKSSLGRLGLLVHITAGLIDPGWHGTITLELANVATAPIRLFPGMKIGQVTFDRLDGRVVRPYGSAAAGSHYQGQGRGPVPSRSHEGFRLYPEVTA